MHTDRDASQTGSPRHAPSTGTSTAESSEPSSTAPSGSESVAASLMPCPNCGAPMPDLKGGKASICMVCGFKDSCCY